MRLILMNNEKMFMIYEGKNDYKTEWQHCF